MAQPLVNINLVFHKDPSFFEPFLASAKAQTYPAIKIHTLDTRDHNIGFWAGQEKLLTQSKGKYVICLSDVVLDPDFVKNAVAVMEGDPMIGALQAKILQGVRHPAEKVSDTFLIDTTGFQLFRSRRIINRGKEEADRGQYRAGEIFAVEGAVPVFRRKALEDCKTPWLIDPDFRIGPYGYGDDLDLAWRMRNLGWKQWYAPDVIGYHDRSTRGPRGQIPLMKRQLDWCNVRFAIIKNDRAINLLKDAPFWIPREIGVMMYTLLFEPGVLKILPRFFKLLPRMLRRRNL